jgi:integrase/recombinase XerC
VQVVDGSNPSTPTTISASKSLTLSSPHPTLPTLVNTLSTPYVNHDEATALFYQLDLLKRRLGLSDRALAHTLGISYSYLSLLRRGLRNPKQNLIDRIIATFPQLREMLPQGLIIPDPVFASISRRTYMDAKINNLRQVIEDFKVAKQAEGCSKDTVAFYYENLVRICWYFKTNGLATDVHEITVHHIRGLLVYVTTAINRWEIGSTSSRKPGSKTTADAYWRTFQVFFSWLVREEIIDEKTNPMKKIPRPDFQTKVWKDIPLALIKKAAEECGSNHFKHVRNRAMILAFLDTGFRLGGCYSMTMSDMDPETGLATILEKGGQQVLVHFNETAMAAIKEYLSLRSQFSSNSFWLKDDGTPLTKSAIQSLIRRLRKYGIDLRWTPHSFRATFAINLLRGGADTFTLQTLGGWKDLEMPRRYTRALTAEDAFKVHRKASPADRMENGPS